RKMSEPASTVYMQTLKPGSTPKKVYGESGFGVLSHVTNDGKSGAFIRLASRTNGTVMLVDLVAGTSKVVYPTSGEVAILDATFSGDGKRLYVSTDAGSEQSFVLAFDTKTLKEVGRYVETKPATASINGILTSKRGNLVGIHVRAGNHDEIRLLDGTTLKS